MRKWVGLIAAIAGLLLLRLAVLLAGGESACTPPLAAFSWEADGLSVLFTNESTGSEPKSYSWAFGDGDTSIQISPTHSYAQAGAYSVSLLVLNGCGGDTTEASIAVETISNAWVYLPLIYRRAVPSEPSPTATPGGTPSPTLTITPTPANPTETPTPTGTATPETPSPSTATPIPTTPVPGFSVGKGANKTQALLGEVIVFTVGLSNQRGQQVTTSVNDTLPDELALSNVSHTCEGNISYNQQSFQGTLFVPSGGVCQIYVVTVVTDACHCDVSNTVNWVALWSGGGDSGSAESGPVFLSNAPTPTPAAGR